MKTFFIIALYIVTLSPEIHAEERNEVEKGTYPFMAFLYYPDDTVLDSAGSRFMQTAVLIRPEWLLTSAIDPNVMNNESDSFPRKTIIARLGAITVDSDFTFNEDENEQEREIIQIVRPFDYNATQWWRTDVTLMKTLYPFNITSAVKPIALTKRRQYHEKNCIALVYAKTSTSKNDEMVLMQLFVELLSPSVENCGRNYVENTMICARDSNENRNANYDSDYCRSNSGGPLICEEDVIGLQTYINNNCRQPHLYQLLSAWDDFITCGIEEKCHEKHCANICVDTKKDKVISDLEDVFIATSTKGSVDETINSTVNIDNTTLTLEIATKELRPTRTVKVVTSETVATTTDTLNTTALSDSEVKLDAQETSTESKETEPQEVKEADKLQRANEHEDLKKSDVKAQQQDMKYKAHNSVQRNMYNLKLDFIGYFLFLCMI